MFESSNTANILAIINEYKLPCQEDISRKVADDFRARRIEKGLTRKVVAEISEVPMANITRFEQTGQISFKNLIQLAMALKYVPEIERIFAEPKYQTLDELEQIRNNSGKKKAYTRKP